MFRQGIRRCAGLAGNAMSTSALLRSRVALPIATSVSRRAMPLALRTLAPLSRSYSVEATAETTQKDANATEEDSAAFADLAQLGLHENLLTAITRDMKFETMTPVQAKTIAPALKGTDIVAQAKTGTGKTLAFLLPLLQRMIQNDPSLVSRSSSYRARSDDIRGIILSPTRELALQIAEEAMRLTKRTGIVVQSAVGGTMKNAMLRQVQQQGCHLLVATPGRLNDLLTDPRAGIAAPRLAAFVLDEADRMLDVGFEKELDSIQGCLPDPAKTSRQTMLVSATIPDNVIRLARSMIRPDDFEFVQTIPEHESLTHERVPQYIVPLASFANVFPSIFELADKAVEKSERENGMPFKAIVYLNTTSLVQLAGEVGYTMRRNKMFKLPTYCIHSKLTQQGRTRASESFRRATSGILFSSDVTARGMDFPNVTHVIQVDTPRDRPSYIHRLGRTARSGKNGEGWLLMPRMSMRGSRTMLANLPLQESSTLDSASADLEAEEGLTKYHRQLAEVMAQCKDLFASTYTSMFGHTVASKRELVDDLNMWATKGVGMEEPPTVTKEWASKMGLRDCNLNFASHRRFVDKLDSSEGDFRSGNRESRFGNRDGGDFQRRTNDRRSGDAFSQMRNQVRSDDDRPRRSGGFGGNRRSRW